MPIERCVLQKPFNNVDPYLDKQFYKYLKYIKFYN